MEVDTRALISGIFWFLPYADDIALIAKNKVALMDMMSTLKKLLKEKKLELIVKKNQVLVFNKKGKEKKKNRFRIKKS